METSIAHLIYGILSAVFLTGVVIIARNIIKIKRSGDDWKQRLKEKAIVLIPAVPELQNHMVPVISKPVFYIAAPGHKMKLLK